MMQFYEGSRIVMTMTASITTTAFYNNNRYLNHSQQHPSYLNRPTSPVRKRLPVPVEERCCFNRAA
jgi:hypothetical protein